MRKYFINRLISIYVTDKKQLSDRELSVYLTLTGKVSPKRFLQDTTRKIADDTKNKLRFPTYRID